jgi:hypothetical protein
MMELFRAIAFWLFAHVSLFGYGMRGAMVDRSTGATGYGCVYYAWRIGVPGLTISALPERCTGPVAETPDPDPLRRP